MKHGAAHELPGNAEVHGTIPEPLPAEPPPPPPEAAFIDRRDKLTLAIILVASAGFYGALLVWLL